MKHPPPHSALYCCGGGGSSSSCSIIYSNLGVIRRFVNSYSSYCYCVCVYSVLVVYISSNLHHQCFFFQLLFTTDGLYRHNTPVYYHFQTHKGYRLLTALPPISHLKH